MVDFNFYGYNETQTLDSFEKQIEGGVVKDFKETNGYVDNDIDEAYTLSIFNKEGTAEEHDFYEYVYTEITSGDFPELKKLWSKGGFKFVFELTGEDVILVSPIDSNKKALFKLSTTISIETDIETGGSKVVVGDAVCVYNNTHYDMEQACAEFLVLLEHCSADLIKALFKEKEGGLKQKT